MIRVAEVDFISVGEGQPSASMFPDLRSATNLKHLASNLTRNPFHYLIKILRQEVISYDSFQIVDFPGGWNGLTIGTSGLRRFR